MLPCHPGLPALLRTPPQSIGDVIRTMEAMEELLGEGDGLRWFHWLYLRVTRAVASRVAAGDAGEPAWLAELDVVFARFYFDALAAWLAGGETPGCWRALFERRAETAIARIQFALAGVNAHINHDLPLALVETFEATGTAPPTATVEYADYTSLNATLESLIDEERKQLLVRLSGELLPEVTHLGDTLAAWSLTAAREAAWTNSELLWDVREIPLISGRYLHVIDGLATVVGKNLLVPVPLLPEA